MSLWNEYPFNSNCRLSEHNPHKLRRIFPDYCCVVAEWNQAHERRSCPATRATVAQSMRCDGHTLVTLAQMAGMNLDQFVETYG